MKLDREFELFKQGFFVVSLKRQNCPSLKLQFYHGKVLVVIINVSVQVFLYRLNSVHLRDSVLVS